MRLAECPPGELRTSDDKSWPDDGARPHLLAKPEMLRRPDHEPSRRHSTREHNEQLGCAEGLGEVASVGEEVRMHVRQPGNEIFPGAVHARCSGRDARSGRRLYRHDASVTNQDGLSRDGASPIHRNDRVVFDREHTRPRCGRLSVGARKGTDDNAGRQHTRQAPDAIRAVRTHRHGGATPDTVCRERREDWSMVTTQSMGVLHGVAH
jgi:hypothetical protein